MRGGEKVAKRIIFISRLMTAGEVHEACKLFREQEAVIRRQQMTCVTNKEASAKAGEPVGCH